MTTRTRAAAATGLTTVLLGGGCMRPFDFDDGVALRAAPERTRSIEAVRFEEQAVTDLVGIDEASRTLIELMADPPARPEPPATLALTLEELRGAALANNLDLEVQLLAPTIAATSVDEAEARFEWVFTAGARRSVTDSPVAVATEGSQVDFESYDAGLRIPLTSGGTISIAAPISRTETNNPFATLDPSFTAAGRFSISQPLLRNAGHRTNTYAIRAAKYEAQIVDARTKLEAIRILAAADRAYWRLYAVRRELEVREQQYELAMDQLERARRRVEAGDVAEIEVIRAESGLAERVEGIIVARNALLRAERDLKRIMNRPDVGIETETGIELVSTPDPVGYELDAAALTDFAVANRMEMLELELQLALDASTVDFERNQALPLVTLDYVYRLNGLGDGYRDAADQVIDGQFNDWSVALLAEIPLGNEAAKSRVNRAMLSRIQRLATREQRSLAIRQEVLDAVDQLRQNWQRIIAARHQAIVAGRTLDGERRQFEVGARTSTDVLDAAARLADAQSREILAVTDYQVAQIDLAFATGTLVGFGRVRWEPIDPDLGTDAPTGVPPAPDGRDAPG